MSDLCFSSIDSMAPRLQKGEVSPVELTQAYLDRIHALDGDLHAYVNLMEESALEEARTAFERALEINPEFGWVKHTLLPSLEERETASVAN